MNISLDVFLALAGTDPARFEKLGELARRLNALDAERAEIVAGLAEFGLTVEPVAAVPTPPRPSADPPCCMCPLPSEMEVNGRWYCTYHGDEQVAGKAG